VEVKAYFVGYSATSVSEVDLKYYQDFEQYLGSLAVQLDLWELKLRGTVKNC